MNKPFIPSSWHLMQMIKSAEAKCDAAREQAKLREEAQADERYARRWAAEAEATNRIRRWGV